MQVVRILHPHDDRGRVSVIMLRWRDLALLAAGQGAFVGQIVVKRHKRKPLSEKAALRIAIVAGLAIGFILGLWVF